MRQSKDSYPDEALENVEAGAPHAYSVPAELNVVQSHIQLVVLLSLLRRLMERCRSTKEVLPGMMISLWKLVFPLQLVTRGLRRLRGHYLSVRGPGRQGHILEGTILDSVAEVNGVHLVLAVLRQAYLVHLPSKVL